MSKKINRRKFFSDSALSAAGIVLGSGIIGTTARRETGIASFDIMEEVMKYRKIDSHAHIWSVPDGPDSLIDSADRLGIEWLSISKPITRITGKGTPEEASECNDIVFKAMKQYPDRFIGFFTLNPLYQEESLREIKRCADLGFAGYKGYIQAKINDPLHYPVIEKLIDHKMLCFMHTECELGLGEFRVKYAEQITPERRRPNATIPEDMVDAARRYPEAMFQWAHIATGDFEYICKCIKNYPNIYVDLSGSNNEEKTVDFCIEQLGEDRLFFGTDGSFYQGVGKILSSNATEAQRKKLFFDNYNNVLRKGGYHVA